MSSSVTNQHQEYRKMACEWEKVRALADGSAAVKKLKTDILPPPDLEEGGEYDEFRYKYYIQRAIYTNITGRTRVGLCGAAFRDDPEVNLGGKLEVLTEDADGNGNSLVQMVKDVFACLLSSGRECLMVDYPEVEQGLTASQENSLGLRPRIKLYTATDFINWRDDATLAVLKESENTSTDEFGHDYKPRYRVLRLRDDGYTQQVYNENGEALSDEKEIMAAGKRLPFIPLFVIGSQNNDWSVDHVPLADVAYINAGHFINSADEEESAHVCGQATPHIDIGNMNYEQWKAANPSGVKLGSRTGVSTSGGKFELVQAQERSVHRSMMEAKEKQMVAVGGRIIEKRDGTGTATEARIDVSGENSVLGDLVTNVEEGFRQALEWCAMFAGETIDSEEALVLSRKFFDDRLDPQAAIAAMQFYDRGIADKDDMLEVGKRASILRQDKAADEINEADPLAGPALHNPLDQDE